MTDTDTQRRADQAEMRKAGFEAEGKSREEQFEAREARIAEAQKYMDARKKEEERRAALSQPDRAAEDAKRAAMTPEERAKDDEAKGLVVPEGFDQINLLAGTPQFTVQTESIPHAAGFILSEANGHQSRDNGNFVGAVTITVGMPVAQSAPASGLVPPTYIPVATTAGSTCSGLAIYGAVIASGTNQYLSILSRNAEVNGKLINWGSLIAADQTAVITALAAKGVIFR
jgi:hypothetical protein